MIKNERQYNTTRKQIELLERALGSLIGQPVPSDPDDALFRQIQENALRGQLTDLRTEAKEYEDLKTGKVVALDLDSIDELPRALIAARISSGMTQRDLAERVGIKEQMIQRYEANEYAATSFSKMREVATALNVGVREEILLPSAGASISVLFQRLQQVGVDRELVKDRILPLSVRAQIDRPAEGNGSADADLAVRAAASVGRVFDFRPAEIFGSAPFALHNEAVGAARFNVSANANKRRLATYSVYAHYLANVLLQATATLDRQPVPTDAEACRRAILERFGELNYGAVLRFVWDLGLPVLPLNDAGAFHGALWRIGGRNVIVLKQRTSSPSRWLTNLLHELGHAAQEPEKYDLGVIEEGDSLRLRKVSPREEDAIWFALDVSLDGRAEDLASECGRRAGGSVERLKAAVPQVARETGVDVGVLADYMAFRLTLDDPSVDWWGAATNLQPTGPDPWREARDLLLARADFTALSRFDQDLLVRAVAEM